MGSNRDIHLRSPSPRFYPGHSGNICPGLGSGDKGCSWELLEYLPWDKG